MFLLARSRQKLSKPGAWRDWASEHALSMSWPRVVALVSITSSSRAVPHAAHFGDGSPGATAFSRRFIFGLVMCFRMNVACTGVLMLGMISALQRYTGLQYAVYE